MNHHPTPWEIAFVIGIVILLLLKLYGIIEAELEYRRQRALITEEENRRWYPTMQAVARTSRLKH